MGEPDDAQRPVRRSLWRRIAGDGTHIGFWTLPVFIATALAGAVIAGAIANVYYAQQVAGLEEETRAARAVAEVAAEDIAAARQEALDAIAEQLDGVRDALEVARPIADPAAAGVVALRVELTPPEPEPAPDAEPAGDTDTTTDGTGGQAAQPGGDGQAQGAPLPTTTEPDDQPGGSVADGAGGPTGPPPAVVGAPMRNASGFVVAVADGQSFVATSYGAVADPGTVDGVAPAVTVASATGSARGVVHAWDEARGVAIVRVALVDVPILPWRPAAVGVTAGDVAVLAAVTPGLVGVQLPGRIGAVTADTIVTDLPVDPVFDGAPLVDALGRVIGVQSSAAEPFGAGSTGAIAARQLCVELISGCELLEQRDGSDTADPDA